jgi:hypothetical protein
MARLQLTSERSAMKRPPEPTADQPLDLIVTAQLARDHAAGFLQTGSQQHGPQRGPAGGAVELVPQATDRETRADERTGERRQDQGTVPYKD